MHSIEADQEDNVVPFRSHDVEGPFAKTPLMLITDSQVSDGEFRLLALIQVRSRRLGYTNASWSTLAEDLGKDERHLRRMGRRLQASGRLKVWKNGLGYCTSKQVMAASEVYGDAQSFGWNLLRSQRDDIDMMILRSQPELPPRAKKPSGEGVETLGVRASTPWGEGLGVRLEGEKSNKKKIDEINLNPGVATPHQGALHGSDKIQGDNQEQIDDLVIKDHMSENEEKTSRSHVIHTPIGEDNDLVKAKENNPESESEKDRLFRERVAHLRNRQQVAMEESAAKARAQQEKRLERARQRQMKMDDSERKGAKRARAHERILGPATVARQLYEDAICSNLGNIIVPKWGTLEMSKAKQLMGEFGEDVVRDGFDMIFGDLDKYRAKYKVEGIPSIGWFASRGLKNAIFGEVQLKSRRAAEPVKPMKNPKFI